MDRIFNCPKIVTTNLKKYGIILEIQFGGVIMESGKNNRNEEMLDDYIGYKLTTENSSRHSSFNLKGIVVAVLIIIGIAMIYDALRPKCAHSGCDNTPEEGSCYCLIHDPKYYNNKNSYTSVFTTATTSRPKTTTASSSATRATRKNTNKTSTSKSAEYDAHDYDDPEDLYEDHYDDFYDYEDAEDYWEEDN